MGNKVYQVNAGGNIYDIDDRQADIDAAQLRQDLIAERERAELAEQQLQQDKQSVVKIVWDEYAHIDQFITPGIYDITGERLTTNDGLPIANASPGHTIAARLTVLSSSIKGDGAEDDKCITQMLVLSNRTGGDGDVYIRTGRASMANQLAGGAGWEPWGKLQQNIEVGAVATYDNLTDNGIYSGVYVGTGSKETFVLVVINDYAFATQLGVARRVSQFKYSVYTGSNIVAYHSRVWDGNVWSAWSVINADEIASMINAAVAKLTNVDAELITRIQALASWVEEHGVEAAQLTAAITAESQRALSAEEAINKRAVDADTLNVAVDADALHLDFSTLDDGAFSGTVEFPAATADKAGVMSAADKVKLEDMPNAIEEGEKRALRRLFINAGARYNDTNKYMVYTTPWADYVDSSEYKAQWNLDVLTGTVQTFVSAEKVTYEYIDDGGEWKIVTRVGDKLIWDDTKVVHRIGCYYLSGLGHLTDSDMITIYNNKDGLYKYYHRGNQDYNGKAYFQVRNRLMYTENDIFTYKPSCFQNNILPVILFFTGAYKDSFSGSAPIASGSVFYNCYELRVVMAVKSNSSINSNAFYNCKKLSVLVFFGLSKNVNLSELPVISKSSILFMLEKAAPTSAITITLHADAYARLAEDADIVAALEAQPLIVLVSA